MTSRETAAKKTRCRVNRDYMFLRVGFYCLLETTEVNLRHIVLNSSSVEKNSNNNNKKSSRAQFTCNMSHLVVKPAFSTLKTPKFKNRLL